MAAFFILIALILGIAVGAGIEETGQGAGLVTGAELVGGWWPASALHNDISDDGI